MTTTTTELVILDGVKIPERPEDKFYVMDPKKGEDLIRGSQLQEGMVVLIEEITMREKLNDNSSDYAFSRFRENNFWCEVTELRFPGDLIEFVGVYHDGVKRSRRYNQSYYWIVKR